MKSIYLLLVVLLLVTSCTSQNNVIPTPLKNDTVKKIESFVASYDGQYQSSSGARVLNISYVVKNGLIISCNGTYSYPAPADRLGQTDNESCNVGKLINGSYNVPQYFPTVFIANESSKNETSGPSRFTWKITGIVE